MLSANGHGLSVPILQGGMGVGVSLGSLAGHVAACGGLGTLSTANPGYREPDFWRNSEEANRRALIEQIHLAREIAGDKGMVAVNAMVATTWYADSVGAAVEAGVDAVIAGAGLPLDLPALTEGSRVALAPVVSGPKAARTLCRYWDKRYQRIPDFMVLEGSLAGGHLGFSREELENGTALGLEVLLPQVLEELLPFCEKYGRSIPVYVAGGLFTGGDIARFTRLGAAGGQLATRFITTHECDAAPAYKQVYLESTAEDVTLLQSPVGMPGRALNTPLLKRLKEGRIPPAQCTRCLKPCNPSITPYCITNALIEAVRGHYEEGLFFCGGGAGRLKLTHVNALMEELAQEWRAQA